MKSALKTHGGKHYLAQQIVALMPQHMHYVEPYFGGGAVLLLAKPHEGISEVANDLNGDLTNFWQVLQDKKGFAEFKRRMEAVPVQRGRVAEGPRSLDTPTAPARARHRSNGRSSSSSCAGRACRAAARTSRR